MLLENFLKQVLPNEGFKCWVEITPSKVPIQGLVPTIEELASKLREIDARGSDAYFGCASFVSPKNRRAGNAGWAQAFWMDIDAGEGKPYATADDAISACDEFCVRADLPLSGMVRSGGGVHAYWPLDRPLAVHEWRPVAQRLKLLAASLNFHADPSRTADIASILRPPGSHNYKLPGNPRPVEVDDEECFEPVSCADFIASVLKNQCVPGPQNINNPLTPVNLQLKSNANLTVGLSKAFDPTQGVAQGCRGSTCLKYAGELVAKGFAQDEVIAKCLGWNQLCAPPQEEKEVRRIIASAFSMHAARHPAPVEVMGSMPNLPRGYRWGNSGELQVQIQVPNEKGELVYEWRTVSQRSVYLSSIMNTEGGGQDNSYLFTQYHSAKGWLNFTMNSEHLNCTDWYKHWFKNGGELMVGADKYFKTYVREASNMLRLPGNEKTRYSQFGWKDGDNSFLVGENLCHADGRVEQAFGTDKLTPLMRAMSPARGGSREAWTAAANKLGTPGMEAHLFMVVASFAATLMKFCVDEGNGGSILSFVSEDSGHGKTPMATAIASVWGSLQATVVTGNFTDNRRIEDLVRHCHMIQVQEEMSYSDPMLASASVEKFTSGSDRGRLDQKGAASGMPERYQTIVVSLSNKSLYELVKMVNGPMSKRIFEIEIDQPEKEMIDNLGGIAREMMRNCGYAGLEFVRLIVNPEIRKYIEEHLRGNNMGKVGSTQLKYRDLLLSRPEHRFIVWPLSAIDVSAQILNHYKIMQFDVQRLMKWAVDHASERTRAASADESVTKLHLFLREHINTCLTVQGPYEPGKGPQMPLRLPTNYLYMRMEMQTKRLYIANDALQPWCTKHNISFIGWGRKLKEDKVLLNTSRPVTLGAGTEIVSARALCWELDMDHPMINGQMRIQLSDSAAAVASA